VVHNWGARLEPADTFVAVVVSDADCSVRRIEKTFLILVCGCSGSRRFQFPDCESRDTHLQGFELGRWQS
jgi:uncharacterized protein (DUF169 family)